MRPGTPGFVGARLVEAREARGLSAVALADLIGVTAQSISYYENDKTTPGPEVLQRLSDRLGLPALYFTKPLLHRGRESAIFYRSMSSAGAFERKRAAAQLRWLRDLSLGIFEHVEAPSCNLPVLDVPRDVTTISSELIEQYAASVRRHWKMGDGPISNVVWLLENNGVIVARMSLGLEKLDGLSAWFDDRPYMVLSSDKNACARSRFDAAHELGHLVLHRDVDQTKLNNTALFKVIEEQAHRFAGAFLFPERSFALEVHPATLDMMLHLKERWRVSVGMMIQRAVDLSIITESAAQALWRKYNWKRWRASEPLDDSLEVESPRLLQRAIDLIVRSEGLSAKDLLYSVPLSGADIERIAGLPPRYFSDDRAEVIDIQPRLRSKAPSEPPHSGATVIPFRAHRP